MMTVSFRGKHGNSIDETWTVCAEAALRHFMSFLSPRRQEQLDYSVGSLLFIEDWLLRRYSTRDGILVEDDTQIIDGVLIYIGLTFQKNLDGFWNVNLLDFNPNEPFPFDEVEIVTDLNKNDNKEDGIRILDHLVETVRKQSGTLLKDTLKAMMLY